MSKPTPTAAEMEAFQRGERPGFHEPDGSPEQHIGAQEQIPNPKTLATAAKLKATTPAPALTPPVVEEKAAKADEEDALYKTREARPSRTKKQDEA